MSLCSADTAGVKGHFRMVKTEYFRGRADGTPHLLNKRRGSWTWSACKLVLISGSELCACPAATQAFLHSVLFFSVQLPYTWEAGPERRKLLMHLQNVTQSRLKSCWQCKNDLRRIVAQLLWRNHFPSSSRKNPKTSNKRSVQSGTCGNLPHTCQEGQQTCSKQKLL